jgi:hypothetical protein
MGPKSPPKLSDLNFKVPSQFHRLFKASATYLEISMKDLLIMSFNYLLEHPDNKAIRNLLLLRPSARKRRSWRRVKGDSKKSKRIRDAKISR